MRLKREWLGPKKCVGCGSDFRIKEKERPAEFVRRKFCSKRCQAVNANNWKGRTATAETRALISKNRKGKMVGEKHFAWKGSEAKYAAIHMWIKDHWTKTGNCEWCGQERFTEWANLDGLYDRDNRSGWAELCRPCHRKEDYHAPKLV